MDLLDPNLFSHFALCTDVRCHLLPIVLPRLAARLKDGA